MRDRIYITGCAKSGTTLLKRMFYAFENTEVIRDEVGVVDFSVSRSTTPGDILVGKRRWDTLFSSSRITDDEIDRQRTLMERMTVINIIRHGGSVISSYQRSWSIPGAEDWISSMQQLWRYSDVVDLVIRYEDLVQSPDYVQDEIEDITGLVRRADFNDYPDFLPGNMQLEDVTIIDDHYAVRPLEVILPPDNWRDVRPRDVEMFDQVLKENGYI